MSYACVPQTSEEIHLSAGSDSEEELLGPNTHQCLQNYKVPRTSDRDGQPSRISHPLFLSHLSPIRRIFFVLSVLLCVVTIITFLWIIPCDVTTCGAAPPALNSHTWTAHLLDLEMMGAVEVVGKSADFSRRGSNIVIMARRDVTMQDGPPFQVICIDGSLGGHLWSHRLARAPHHISCQLLDVNRDGVLDCVVSGEKHMLKVIDPVSGLPLWEVGGRGSGIMALPVVLPDLTGDGVPELVTARSYGPHTELLLVSGASGAVVGPPVPCPAVCARVTSIVVEQLAALSYTCTDTRGKRSEQTMPLAELLSTWGVRLPEGKGARSVSGVGDASVDGHRLLVDNQGHCPEKCRLHIVVKDRNNNTVYNRSMNDVYGTAPVPLSLGGLTGFLLKCWHLQGSCAFNTSTDGSCTEWAERVTLVTFNGTDVHVVNVSQKGIIQWCYHNNTVTPAVHVCQPDHHNAYLSMRISDMDGDGSRELVSVTPTHELLHDGRWRLQSDVTSVGLEHELPLLFDPHNNI